MDAEVQAKLREKFDTARIGLKPKITCKACSDSRTKTCDKHQKETCKSLRGGPGCGQWITPQHMHIEFVGHADVTDRLLDVDPEWDWEPVAYGPDGLPAFDKLGGLWIKLTIAGKTRIGYGGADGKQGEDAVKEAISDAIKTTAMRFGVALDLWRKGEASGKPAEDTPADPPRNTAPPPAPPKPSPADAARSRVRDECGKNGWDLGRVAALFQAQYSEALKDATEVNRINAFVKNLYAMSDADLKAPATNGAQA